MKHNFGVTLQSEIFVNHEEKKYTEMLLFLTIKRNINFFMFQTQFLVKKDYFSRVLDFNFFPVKFEYENELNYNKFYQGRIDHSHSPIHVVLHSATVTNRFKDHQFMNPLLLLYM